VVPRGFVRRKPRDQPTKDASFQGVVEETPHARLTVYGPSAPDSESLSLRVLTEALTTTRPASRMRGLVRRVGPEVAGICRFHAVQSRVGAMPDTLRLELGSPARETEDEQPGSFMEALEVRR
jgi:hypothetical protein